MIILFNYNIFYIVKNLINIFLYDTINHIFATTKYFLEVFLFSKISVNNKEMIKYGDD